MKKIIFAIAIIIIAIFIIVFFKNANNENTANTNLANIENSTENEIIEESNEIVELNYEDTENYTETSSLDNNYKTNIEEGEIAQVVSPAGFMGSSLYRVVLFSTGEVYVQKYDGTEENILSEDLVAKEATSIETIENDEDERYGEVIIKGTQISSDYGWIEFE